MQLIDILEGSSDSKVSAGNSLLEVRSIESDSRNVVPGSMFVAIKGYAFDGANFIDSAVENGAVVVVSNIDHSSHPMKDKVCFIYEEDTKLFLRKAVEKFYGNPSEQVKTIGITGTNGKTTIAYLIESILHEAEKSCAVVGTVNYRIGERVLPAQNTTPGFLDIQRMLADMAAEGVEYCVIEVSSHALVQGRTDLIHFCSAVFTNLTSDHLDYHKTRENYFAAKSKLFIDLSSDATSIINADDVYGRKLFSKTESHILTYGIERKAEVMAQDIELDINETKFKLFAPEGEVIIRSKLVGLYNIYNILAATSVALKEGISLDRIKTGIERLTHVPGRLEKVDYGQDFTVLIDYAHTEDALENVLNALRYTSDAKIILVFGCGGDRDKSKRPLMGGVACQGADFSIITSDNPRSEDPELIIKEIAQGFDQNNYRIEVQREKAILTALEMANKGDIVLITGKGHETYQIFKDQTIPFDERKIIRQFVLC